MERWRNGQGTVKERSRNNQGTKMERNASFTRSSKMRKDQYFAVFLALLLNCESRLRKSQLFNIKVNKRKSIKFWSEIAVITFCRRNHVKFLQLTLSTFLLLMSLETFVSGQAFFFTDLAMKIKQKWNSLHKIALNEVKFTHSYGNAFSYKKEG